MTEARAHAAAPLAARLIAAVALRDADEVAKILARCTDKDALAVVLAENATLPARLPNNIPANLTPEERRAAHARYYNGQRDAMTVLGEREYQRERKRHRDEDAAAPPRDISGDGRWVNRGGVQEWIPNTTGAVA